ncbi:MAG: hypothetical protein JNM22_16060 [Saprospiraceae bacterium]|nr:hypothetical protein [Saprospiraceae bacterium]
MRNYVFPVLFLSIVLLCCQQIPGIEQPLESGLHSGGTNKTEKSQSATATADPKIVIRSLDGGQTWENVSAGIPKGVPAGHILAQGQEVLLAGNGLYRLRSNDPAARWEKDFFWKDQITGIFPGKKGPYYCNFGSGFYREIPHTGVWLPMHENLPDPFVRAVLETSDGVLFAGCNSGIYKSDNDGKDWKQVFEGEIMLNFEEVDGMLFCGGFKGLLRSKDGGEHWERVLTEDAPVRRIDHNSHRLLALSNDTRPWEEALADKDNMVNTLRFSEDGGVTWQRMDGALRSLRFTHRVQRVISPSWIINDIQQSGKYLFCSMDAGIFRSSDQGKSWQLVYEADVPNWSAYMTVCDGVIYAVLSAGC